MRATAAACAAILWFAACSTRVDPVGTWEVGNEALQRTVETTSQEHPGLAKALSGGGLAGWKLTVEFTPDNRFALTMSQPPTERGGTWAARGNEVELTTTTEGGRTLTTPLVHTAVIDGGQMMFHLQEGAAAVVLEKSGP